MSDDTTPRLEDVLRLAVQSHLQDVHVALPAEVIDYDATKQTISCQPVINRVLRTEDGERKLEKLPPLYDVPIAFQRSGGFFVSFPLSAGDTVLLIFCERNTGEWRKTGSGDPVDTRTHSLSSPVAIPGVYRQGISDGTFEHLAMGADGGKQIHIKSDSVNLGSESPGDKVALASLVEAELDKIHAAITTGVPAGGSSDGGTAYQTSMVTKLGSRGSVGSTVTNSD